MRIAFAILLVLLLVVLARALPQAQEPGLSEGGFLMASARVAVSLVLMVAAILVGAYVLLLVLTG